MGTVGEATLKKLNRRTRVHSEPVRMPGYQKMTKAKVKKVVVFTTEVPQMAYEPSPEPEPTPELSNWDKVKDKVSQWLR